MKKYIILSILAISILVPLYLAHDAHASTPTQITLTSSNNPSFIGVVVFTAKVSPSAATGTVQLLSDGVPIPIPTGQGKNPTSLTGGVATFASMLATPGTHQITAKYSGDSNYAASTSSALAQTITKVTVTVTSSQSPSVYGQPVTFTITVSPSNTPGPPQLLVDDKPGTVTWKGGKTGDGVYAYTTSQIPGSSYGIGASFFNGYNRIGSGYTTQIVKPAPTTTGVTASPNPTTFGTWIKLSATVSPSTGPGLFQFLVDGSPSSTPQTVNGVLSYPFSGGTHQVAAKFLGNQNYAASTSPPITLTVNKVPTTTTVHASVGSIGMNGIKLAPQVSITVTVTPNLALTASTGTIQITLDGKTGQAGQINKGGYASSGSASTLSKGVHHISAKYSGDSNYMPSSSPDTTFTVS